MASSSSNNDDDDAEKKKKKKKNVTNKIGGIIVVASALAWSLFRRRNRRREENALLQAFFTDVHPSYTPSVLLQYHKGDTYWNYEIEKGDTLWGISAKYEVSVGTLKDVNGLYGDDIYVGDTLIIPRQ